MERIGRYNILGEIGRGAMGVVYRAQDPAIGRIVAIKTIRLGELADTSERAKLRDRLMREAQSAGILSHPGIVTIYDVAEQDDLAYISMEFVDGPTLQRMAASDPPDGKLVLEILAQTAAALDFAHKRGIVHRDIKPANIMIHERATAKITDFGVARIQSHQLTQVGSMVGTPNYMSPEQIQGQPVDGRSDQFSLAVIAYELLTGEKPFTAESIPALAFKIVQEDALPVHRLNPTLDWPVDTVVKRAMSKNPADRYPTCSDFAFAIENACRASKNWKPAIPGALQNLPTLAEAPPVERSKPRNKPEAAPIAARRPLDVQEEEPPPPRAFRWARNLALAVIGVAVLGAALMAGLQMFDNDLPADTASTALPSDNATATQSPSPVPPPRPGAEDAPPGTVDETAGQKEEADTAANESAAEPPASVRRTEAAKPVPATPAHTRLVTNPPGATLVVDGATDLTCRTPCEMELSRGRHTLAATLDGFRRTLKIFEVPAPEDVFINMDRTSGTLMVRSEPRGASITVDGQSRSETTPALLTLPTGRHSIEVRYDNRRETHEVTIRESVITNLAVNLQ